MNVMMTVAQFEEYAAKVGCANAHYCREHPEACAGEKYCVVHRDSDGILLDSAPVQRGPSESV